MAAWIDPLKVVVCSGAGGVGKTTCAAALGLFAAHSGRRVLVLTVDPARRLADAMGIGAKNELQAVARFGKGELSAEMVDPAAIFADFVRRSSPRPEAVERLLRNRLFQQLTSTVSGSQEFTSLERLLQVCESSKYDLIVLDTPPAQNATDFLRSPERIFSLFQESVTQWFVQDERPGLLRQMFNRGTKAAIGAMEKVTGEGFLTELSEFFLAAAEFQGAVAERSIAVHRLLAQDTTGFALVTAFDEAKLKEALEFANDLSRSGHHLRTVIINRAQPVWLAGGVDQRSYGAADDSLQRLVGFRDKLAQFYSQRENDYEEVLRRLHAQVKTLKIPEQRENIEGLSGLERVAKFLGGDE